MFLVWNLPILNWSSTIPCKNCSKVQLKDRIFTVVHICWVRRNVQKWQKLNSFCCYVPYNGIFKIFTGKNSDSRWKKFRYSHNYRLSHRTHRVCTIHIFCSGHCLAKLELLHLVGQYYQPCGLNPRNVYICNWTRKKNRIKIFSVSMFSIQNSVAWKF